MIKFDVENKVQDYTFVLSLKTHDHLGQIRNIDPDSVVSKINMNAANELSFTVYKYNEAEYARAIEKGATEDIALRAAQEPLWDEITDFKYVYVKEIGDKGEYYEITVDKNDEESLYKTITATSACHMELSQSLVHDLEINTELDIARTDYVDSTIFYNKLTPEASLLNRVLYKLPQYSIGYVDSSLMNIQRTFSFDGTDVLSVFNEISEEIKCLFVFDTVDRTISAYDLMTVCIDCGERGEFSDVCPKCGSTDIKYYGEDTTVYIDTENLAEGVNLTVDTESVKNCFKLEAGDDNMTAAVVNLNPTGSDYIYYFSEDVKRDMPDTLVNKIESYDALVEQYRPEYEQKTEEMYEAIDKIIYYTSGMMPTREDDPTNSKLEAAKLTEANLNPMGLSAVTSSTSTATVNTALKEYAKVFVKSGYYKIEVNEGEFAYEGTNADDVNYGYWYGNFKVTNYSDEEDVTISEMIKITVNDDFESFIEQKIKKKLSLDDEEKGSIYDVLSIEDLSKFKEALTYYCLNRLTSFYDSVQGCIDIMIEMDLGRENNDLYQTMYLPYYNKLQACQDEIDKRQDTIDEWGDTLDRIDARRAQIQKLLDFEAYLGTEMYKMFCLYKREDKFTNENYISDGLENDEIFKRAKEFLEAAETEIIKASSYQHQISSTLTNLLCMEEFEPIKDKFKVGNFIRIGIDGQVYRLRLLSYEISFGDIQNIEVEFSDVTKIRNGVSDLQSVLNQASSMASTYSAYAHQVESSKEQTSFVKNFVEKGFDATAVKIVNNAKNENITLGDAGLLARRKDEFYEKYDDTQLKLMSTGIYVTDNAWRSVKTAVGKYYYTNPETDELTEAYGLLAESLVGNLILGNELGIYSSDGSATMSFDNYGLVLNTIDNGTGQYKRILDIQKTDADGNTTSQLYIDTDGNIVLATDQVIQMEQTMDNIQAEYGNFEKIYVKEATIRELLAEYAKIEKLEAEYASIEKLEAEYATIENLKAETAKIGELEADNAVIHGKLEANEAEIKDLTANNATITGKLEAAEAEIRDLEATKATIGYVDAYKVEVEQLFADYASIEYLETNYIKTEAIDAKYAQIEQLKATNAEIEKLVAKDAEIENLVAEKATIEDLNATNATIDNLKAKDAEIENLVADKVDAEYVEAELIEAKKAIVDDLEATYAKIETLESDYAKISYVDAEIVATEKLIAEKATIEELNAAKAEIGELDANVANITSIMAGNIGAGLIQTIHLTGQNVIIDDAIIKSAMIEALSADKLTTGTIDTDEITIKSQDGSMVLQGNLQQFKDENGTVRIQIGKDAEGKFTFVLYDEDGQGVLIDSSGIQSSDAIGDGLIVDSKVADNAAIQGSKLDIDSVITEINDNGTTTINSTKIWIDEENQSLGAKFDSITTIVEEAKEIASNTQSNAIRSVDIMYALGDSNTVAPIDGWNTDSPKWTEGMYIWQKNVVTYADGNTKESSPICISGVDGQEGRSIVRVINYYLATPLKTLDGVAVNVDENGLLDLSRFSVDEDGTLLWDGSAVDENGVIITTAGEWTEEVQLMTSVNRYLWNYEVFIFTDGTALNTEPCIIGAYGEQGEDGIGIKSIIEYYALSSDYAEVPTRWQTTAPTMTSIDKYLWNYEHIIFTNGKTEDTSKRVIGVYGDTGSKGDTGVGIETIVEEYYLSTSNVEQLDGEWKITQDEWNEGKYIWTRSKILWTDGTESYTEPVLADALNKANESASNALKEIGTKVSQTDFIVEQGRIESLIKETTTITKEDGTATSLKDVYNETVSTIDGVKTTIADVSTSVNNLTGEVEAMNSKITEVETTADGIFAKVSSIGGQNLFYHSSKDWIDMAEEEYIYVGCYKESTDKDMEGKNVTLSIEFKTDTTTSGTFDICYYGGDTVTEDDLETLFSNVSISDLSDGKYVNTFVYPTTSALPEAEDGSEQMYTMVIKVTNITGLLSVRKGMLQYGLIATEWQPTSDNLSESIAEVSIEADKINWLVKSGTDESNFELTSRAATLVANEINLKGLVTFSGLNSDIADMIATGGSTSKKTTDSGYEFIDRRYESDIDCRPFILGEYEVVSATELVNGTENDPNLIKTVNDARLYTDFIPWNFNENPFRCSVDVYYADTIDGSAYVQVGFFDENKEPIGSNNGYNLNLISNKTLSSANTWQTFEYDSNNKIVSNDSYPRYRAKYIRFRYFARYNGATGISYLRNFTIKQLGANTSTILNTDMGRWTSSDVISGTTTINGGYLQTNTIGSAQVDTEELFADNAFIGAVQTVELNANMIKSGTIHADLLDLYDMKVTHKDTGIETLNISNAGEITLRGSIESYNYSDGRSGWAILSDGNAEFNDVEVRGSVIGNYGGIASCGGSGINLQQWSSFFDGTTKNKWVLGSSYSVDTSFLCDGINTIKFSRTGSTSDSAVYAYTNRSNNPIIPVVGKPYTASAKFYTKNLSAIDSTKPILGIWFYNSEGTTLQSEKVDIPFANNEWITLSITSICPANAAYMAIVVGAYRNGEFWFAKPKLEEGTVATSWSIAPEDGIKQVVHWAGASYEERDNAPAIIYNDGSVKFETGEFGGVFTGEVEIGNISIIDPSKHSGNDANLIIQNGNNGIKRVQLRDTDTSSFAQNIMVTDNFYNESVTLSQDGYVHATDGVNVGDDETFSALSPTRLTLNEIVIDAATSGTLKMLPTTLNVGSTSKKTNLNVYGETTLNDDLTVKGDITISDKLKITSTFYGVDISFIG